VYCASSPDIAPHYLALAREVGERIAELGWRLIWGGENVSMMGIVARAVRDGGSRTIGVVPKALLHRVDPECDELVVTDDVRSRKAQMELRADAFLALPGGIGTCEELFEAWTSRTIGLHAKPVVMLDPDGHYAGLLRWVQDAHRRGFVSASWLRSVTVVATTADALSACAAGSVEVGT
jgi:hypothetical protein